MINPAQAPKNGIAASDAMKDKVRAFTRPQGFLPRALGRLRSMSQKLAQVEAAAKDLETVCPANPARTSLEGVWESQLRELHCGGLLQALLRYLIPSQLCSGNLRSLPSQP